jgi:hypothetical protein
MGSAAVVIGGGGGGSYYSDAAGLHELMHRGGLLEASSSSLSVPLFDKNTCKTSTTEYFSTTNTATTANAVGAGRGGFSGASRGGFSGGGRGGVRCLSCKGHGHSSGDRECPRSQASHLQINAQRQVRATRVLYDLQAISLINK